MQFFPYLPLKKFEHVFFMKAHNYWALQMFNYIFLHLRGWVGGGGGGQRKGHTEGEKGGGGGGREFTLQ